MLTRASSNICREPTPPLALASRYRRRHACDAATAIRRRHRVGALSTDLMAYFTSF